MLGFALMVGPASFGVVFKDSVMLLAILLTFRRMIYYFSEASSYNYLTYGAEAGTTSIRCNLKKDADSVQDPSSSGSQWQVDKDTPQDVSTAEVVDEGQGTAPSSGEGSAVLRDIQDPLQSRLDHDPNKEFAKNFVRTRKEDSVSSRHLKEEDSSVAGKKLEQFTRIINKAEVSFSGVIANWNLIEKKAIGRRKNQISEQKGENTNLRNFLSLVKGVKERVYQLFEKLCRLVENLERDLASVGPEGSLVIDQMSLEGIKGDLDYIKRSYLDTLDYAILDCDDPSGHGAMMCISQLMIDLMGIATALIKEAECIGSLCKGWIETCADIMAAGGVVMTTSPVAS